MKGRAGKNGICALALAGLLLLALAFGTELAISRAALPSFEVDGDFYDLFPEHLTAQVGYAVEGDALTPVQGDPQLYVDLTGAGRVGALLLTLNAPLEDTFRIQVFHSPDGLWNEEASVSVLARAGADFVKIPLPEGEHGVLRLDVDGPISVRALQAIPSAADVRVRYPFSVPRLALIFACLALATAACRALIGGFEVRGRRFDPLAGVKRRLRRARERACALPVPPERSRKRRAVQLARSFFVIALVCGALLCFLTPPLCVSDEDAHFANVYALSRGDMFPDEYEGKLVHWLPERFRPFMERYPDALKGVTNEARYRYNDMVQEGYVYFEDEWEAWYPCQTGIVSLGYGVSALSIALGTQLARLLQLPEIALPYNQVILGRLGNLLFYITVVYFAIRRAPHFNRTIALLALMPISLFQGASLSYDAVAIPVSLYFVALVMDLSADGDAPLGMGDVIRVLLCVFMLSGMKFGAYMPLFALLLAIPKRKYGSAWRLVACVALVAVAAVAGYLPSYIESAREARLMAANGLISHGVQQTQWLLDDLANLPRLLHLSHVNRGELYIQSFWGLLGWLDAYPPAPVMILGYVVLFGVGLYEACTCPIWREARWKNLLGLAAAGVSALGIFLAMYLSFTPVGYHYIEGVQGRYLIPTALAFTCAFSNQLLCRAKALNRPRAEGRALLLTEAWGACCGVMAVLIVALRYSV